MDDQLRLLIVVDTLRCSRLFVLIWYLLAGPQW